MLPAAMKPHQAAVQVKGSYVLARVISPGPVMLRPPTRPEGLMASWRRTTGIYGPHGTNIATAGNSASLLLQSMLCVSHASAGASEAKRTTVGETVISGFGVSGVAGSSWVLSGGFLLCRSGTIFCNIFHMVEVSPSAFEIGLRRELGVSTREAFLHSAHFPAAFAKRLAVEHVLEGHQGCVNRLAWNEDGSRLASGSDDRKARAGHACRCR